MAQASSPKRELILSSSKAEETIENQEQFKKYIENALKSEVRNIQNIRIELITSLFYADETTDLQAAIRLTFDDMDTSKRSDFSFLVSPYQLLRLAHKIQKDLDPAK